MKAPVPTLSDFPADRPNCGNCTQSRALCPRAKSNKQIHNGLIYRNGEVQGIIYRCLHYKGKYDGFRRCPDGKWRKAGEQLNLFEENV